MKRAQPVPVFRDAGKICFSRISTGCADFIKVQPVANEFRFVRIELPEQRIQERLTWSLGRRTVEDKRPFGQALHQTRGRQSLEMMGQSGLRLLQYLHQFTDRQIPLPQ